MYERIGNKLQGGVVALPIPELPTGIMRGRFHPGDGQLYVAGLFGWAGNKTKPGGFYRIRYTGKPVCVPNTLHATKEGMVIRFTETLDPKSGADPENFCGLGPRLFLPPQLAIGIRKVGIEGDSPLYLGNGLLVLLFA